ncbi:MAG: Crp/Fnr family transcriptional regulator [Desulfotomaculum sp.]|nr:Crp/Fnr family transcriptional regulator [Desulfotomaculum sp.]
MEDLLTSLKKCLLFQDKSEAEIKTLLSNINYKLVNYQKNSLIFSTGRHAGFLGIVLSGSVAIQKNFPDGKVVTVLNLATAKLFGEFIIFSKKQLYPVDVIAAENCQVLLISKQNLLKLLAADSQILALFLESAANRLLVLHEKIEILSLGSIAQKIAYFLLKELTRQKSTTTVKLPFSKTAWAEQMNISRPALSRELRQLSLKGFISFDKKIILVKDIAGLQQLLETELA